MMNEHGLPGQFIMLHF